MPIYEIPDDDLVQEVLIPAMAAADEVRIGAGFFSSHCLAQVAPGLAVLVNARKSPLRLLLSPSLSAEDRTAIERGVKSAEQVIVELTGRLFEGARLSESAVVRHTLDCLAWLIATKHLELRFVLMPEGMYHKKLWLFRSAETWAAVHGSGNATARGLLVNGEQMTVDRPWSDGEAARRRVETLVRQWDRQWNNEHGTSLTLPIEQGLILALNNPPERVPTVKDFWAAWLRDHDAGLAPALPQAVVAAQPHLLAIPDDLNWREGPYSHQGRAVDAWEAAGGRGIMAIATGGGKTKTALVAASRAQERHGGRMLLIVLVPTKPLLLQWADDCREFGVEPVLPSLLGKARRKARLEELRSALLAAGTRTEVVILTNALFAQDRSWRDAVSAFGPEICAMLVADEVHNLGVQSFLGDPPERFDLRLGLSATPIRQYDPDGTDNLFSFFGHQIFEFGIDEAVEAGCLTPYHYHLHEVELTRPEMDRYTDLTAELRAAGFRKDDDGRTVIPNAKVKRLLRERRALLEQATGKLEILRALLISQGPANITRTLIYTSAKPSIIEQARQIEQVNVMLSELGIISHRFTNAETARADAQELLRRFGAGDYQVLTAMKVLDEGIDIPQTDTAYVLAASTVRREWVQRRGRILRRAPQKTHATLHDFLVIPPDPSSSEGQSVLRGELARADEFAHLAENHWSNDGPRQIISKYEDLIWSGRVPS